MNLDPTDKSLARKRAREIAEADLLDIEAYIEANPTLIDGYPPDPIADAVWALAAEHLWDELEDEDL